MPIVRYFAFVGGALLALLFAVGEFMPQLPAPERAEAGVEKSIIRIRSERKWPERVVFDTNQPTIVPAQAAAAPVVPAEAPVANNPTRARELQAFAQVKPSEPKKPEPKPQHKHRTAKSRAAPPMVMVAQQPRFGFFDNSTW
jgi:hypothetical protein